MKANTYSAPDCRYQKHVQCDELNKCHKCGWNPAVRELRILENRELAERGELCRREVRKLG